MPDSISILICTHDRSALLRRTLNSLKEIELPHAVEVELIIVANACTDDTIAMMDEILPMMQVHSRYVIEVEVGLSVARNHGVNEAKGSIVAFLDDDVAVDHQWLIELMRVYREQPADFVGGRVDLWWEAVQQPAWFNSGYNWLLSGCDCGAEIFEMKNTEGAIGANFSFRKSVFEKIGGFRADLGRVGTAMMAGEETDFIARALAAGFRGFHAPRVVVRHWVPPARATPRYICRAMQGFTRSSVMMKPAFGPSAAVRSIGGNVLLFAQHAVGNVSAVIRRDKNAATRHRIRMAASRGALAGALQRLTGRAAKASQSTSVAISQRQPAA